MPTIAEQLTQLQTDKQTLVNNLMSKGVTADNSETFTTLVPKVLDIPAGGGDSSLNIFVQDEEPETKNGLWIKDEELSGNEIFLVSNTIKQLVFNDSEDAIPSFPLEIGDAASAVVGTDMYIFGGQIRVDGTTSITNRAFKYDTLTKTYTEIASMPYTVYGCRAASIGTNIYIFGGTNANWSPVYNYGYKYDTLTNTYTKMATAPFRGVMDLGMVSVGEYVYILGGWGTSNYKSNVIYRYDPNTDSYSAMSNIPITLLGFSVIKHENCIYVFGGRTGSSGSSAISNSDKIYEYDTTSNIWTKVGTCPYLVYGSGCYVTKDDCYVMGGYSTTRYNTCFKFNFKSKIVILLDEPIPDTIYMSSTETINDTLYSIGGNIQTGLTMKTFTGKFEYNIPENIISDLSSNTIMPILDVENGNPVLLNNGTNGISTLISEIRYYNKSTGTTETLESYYGDGTQWVLIE